VVLAGDIAEKEITATQVIMQQFKVRQDGFREIRKQLLIRAVPIMLVSATAGVVISSINSKNKESDINVLPFMIPFIVMAVGIGLYRGLKRQKNLFESFTLTLLNNLITREQLNTPTVSIYFNEIKEIRKNRNGTLTVRGKNPTDIIHIPTQIENYSELELLLNKIIPITVRKKEPILEKYPTLLSFLVLGLMFCVYTTTNRIVVAISGTLLTPLMVWGFYDTRRSKNIDSKTRRFSWWILLVLLSIIGVMVVKLTGHQQIR
jgi:hypothetical protein